jgi:hypothetical protein
MAYMNQEKKRAINEELKKVVPKGWKYSLSVRNHSSIVMTISKADVDLVGLSHYPDDRKAYRYLDLNIYHLHNAYDGELLEIFEKIKAALNLDNYDNSDSQSDYFDVGHYVDIKVGAYDKPFQFIQSN